MAAIGRGIIQKAVKSKAHNSYRRILHCEKKLARLLFHSGVVNTLVDDCDQQIPSVALLTTTPSR